MFIRTIRPLFLFIVVSVIAGQALAKGSADGVWKEISTTSAALRSTERSIDPSSYRTFRLDRIMLQTILQSAPQEMLGSFGISNTILSLPMPDGTFERFRIEHSLIVEPGLVEKYPELGRTFVGYGIDDPAATVRFDLMPHGFHSMILSPRGTVMVDPYSRGDADNYISYYKRDVEKPAFACDFDRQDAGDSISRVKKSGFGEFIPDAAGAAPSVTSGTQFRTYRLALAATNEYAAAVGGNTIAGALAAQVTIMNRVNGVYERELSMRMVIIANNNLIVYAGDQLCGGVACTAANDPYANDDGSTMLNQNITNVNTVIGLANYDIGHVFSTGGGGVAGLGVVCGSSKARGVTGLSNPVGDVFAIDFVAHELGHQWGANHTFNSTVGFCGSAGQRDGTSSYEPGSGITIMAYAGICGSQNLAGNSIDSFHVKSLEDIVAYSQTGNGNTCASTAATGNTPPSVSVVGGPTFNIPRLTPFTLAANATDANGDTITYDWQEYDLGPGTGSVPNTDSDGSARPIFRVFAPNSSPSRTFPQYQHILGGNVPPDTTGGFLTGELLPAIARTMNFQVIARDNRANGGGINTATATVNVAATGPFQVTSPNSNITWFLNSNPVVTWNTGGSESAPINVANVRILLSTDGGATFPTVLAASTANDGAEAVVSPAINTSTARIRVEPIGNIFFDISNTDFTISNVIAQNGAIAGRITTPGGRGVARVYVVLSGGGLPSPRVALTSTFGYYRFNTVGFGQSYTITPQPRKNMTFNPTNIVRNHSSEATDVNFTAN